MEVSEITVKSQLMEASEEFRRLAQQHQEYERQIAALEVRAHFTPEDEKVEHELKKLKLYCKDQMLFLMKEHSAITVH